MKKGNLIIGADLASDLGARIIGFIMVDLLVFNCRSHVLHLVLMGVSQQLPSIVFSPVAGVWIDRLGPRTWLIVVSLFKCGLIAFYLFASSGIASLSFYLLFLTASLFFNIGHLSLVSLSIPGDKLFSFRALNERIAIFGSIMAPMIICEIIAAAERSTVLALAAFSTLASAGMVQRIPEPGASTIPSRENAHGKEDSRNLFETYKTVIGDNIRLKKIFLILGFSLVGGGIFNFGLTIFFKERFVGDISQWGVVMSSYQLGSFLGTLLLAPVSKSRDSQSKCALVFILLSGALLLLCYVESRAQLALLMVLFGAGFTLQQLFLEILIQRNGLNNQKGKIMALVTLFRGLCFLVTILFGAVAIMIFGVRFLLATGAIITGSVYFLIRR